MDKHKKEEFQAFLFSALILENWILDFGRPIANHFIESPLYLPGLGDLFHIIYNFLTAFLLLRILETSTLQINQKLKDILIITFLIGSSMHLVGDSVQTRLIKFGYDLNLPVDQNPMITKLGEPFISFFDLLYFYDEYLGHYLWYIAYFICFLIYLKGSFKAETGNDHETEKHPLLLISGGIYFFYTVIEGQVSPIFFPTYLMMLYFYITAKKKKLRLGVNGMFIFRMFSLTAIITVIWTIYHGKVAEFWPVFQKTFM